MLASIKMMGTIHWQDLSVVVNERTLLRTHSGTARAGRLLAVMGPSGAGKSVFLHALAGLAPTAARVTGHVWDASGESRIGVPEGTMALLEQDVPFFSELTPREIINFAAQLEGLSSSAAEEVATALLQRMGLQHVADQKVGERYLGGTGQGISGGEQRRLALACALAGEEGAGTTKSHAKALLCDEPTTGLDTFQAFDIVKLLRDLSVGRTCATILSIHQPRSSVWALIDDLLLLSPGGQAVYCGPSENVLKHFAALGHACSLIGVNPADFLIDKISVHTSNASIAADDQNRISSLAIAFRSSQAKFAAGQGTVPTRNTLTSKNSQASHRISAWRAFWLLSQRAWAQMLRDKVTNLARLGATVGLALIFGAQFGKFDSEGAIGASTVSSRVGLLSFGGISMAFIGEMRALDRFAKEKKVIWRERAASRYNGVAYLMAKAVAELPSDALLAGLFGAVVHYQCTLRASASSLAGICALVALCCAALGLAIGALVPNGERAMTAGVPIMTVHMLTGVIDPAGAAAQNPNWVMRALRSVSPIRYAIEALCHAEFGGAQLAQSPSEAAKIGGLAFARTGEVVIGHLGITRSQEEAITGLGLLCFAHLLAAAVILTFMQPSFRRAQPPKKAIVPVNLHP
eukprot:TRINITY_DN21330_c0_g2_i1.p1 TRINITY_DN21330_c0_g2~~TRINITY_DN21330_c0_g2_i1.p1  ORF type:complete len:634 (-),score=89.27 TRINITY_DN21330_c0_g2_i1:397-2298(-)